MGGIVGYVASSGTALAAPREASPRVAAPLRLAGAHLVAVLETTSEQPLDVFSEQGLCYRASFEGFPLETSAGDGRPLVSLIGGDLVCDLHPVGAATHYALVTEGGALKRIERRSIAKVDAEGEVVFNVPLDDRIVAVVPHGADDDLILSTAAGKALRIEAATVRPVLTGDAGGVTGIALAAGDRVVSACPAAGEELLVLHARGAAKRVPLAEYPRKGRATGGVASALVDRPTRGPAGEVAAAVALGNARATVFSERGRLIPLDLGGIVSGTRAVVSKPAFALDAIDRPRGLVAHA